MSRQPPGIMARIREMRRAGPATPGARRPPSDREDESLADEVAGLRARVAHLEQLLQGLQDSVHRGFERQDKTMSEIEKRIDPAALASALSKDARERGL